MANDQEKLDILRQINVAAEKRAKLEREELERAGEFVSNKKQLLLQQEQETENIRASLALAEA